jgi:ABC-2 type transport system permease protein
MRVLALVLKDLRQISQDRKSAIFLVLMPILFTLFFGVAFAATEAETRLPVGWINHDPQGVLSAALLDWLAASDSIRPIPLEGEEAEQAEAMVGDGRLAGAVVVPEGFSARVAAGERLPLTMIALRGTPAGQTASAAVQAATKRLLGGLQSAHISADTVQAQLPAEQGADHRSLVEEASALTNAAWQEPALSVVMKAAVHSPASQARIPQGFAQSSPGMIVQFAVFSLITSAMLLVLERKSGALQRLLTTPMHPVEVIAGHLLAMFVVVFLQEVLLVALGQFAFGVDYLHAPAATLLMMLTLALWAASLGLLIGAGARAEQRVVTFSLIAMFVFAALGGAWFPLEVAGKGFAAVGRFMPSAWAMEGFQNIAVRGLGLGSALLPAGILLAYALAFFGLAAWRFRFE